MSDTPRSLNLYRPWKQITLALRVYADIFAGKVKQVILFGSQITGSFGKIMLKSGVVFKI